MSMNRTCPISSLTSDAVSGGMKVVFYVKTCDSKDIPIQEGFSVAATNLPFLHEQLRFIRPRRCKRFAVSARRKSRSFGGGFRHDPDLLREGDEARVVLVGTQERIAQQLMHTPVVRRPRVLQPLEHLL